MILRQTRYDTVLSSTLTYRFSRRGGYILPTRTSARGGSTAFYRPFLAPHFPTHLPLLKLMAIDYHPYLRLSIIRPSYHVPVIRSPKYSTIHRPCRTRLSRAGTPICILFARLFLGYWPLRGGTTPPSFGPCPSSTPGPSLPESTLHSGILATGQGHSAQASFVCTGLRSNYWSVHAVARRASTRTFQQLSALA